MPSRSGIFATDYVPVVSSRSVLSEEMTRVNKYFASARLGPVVAFFSSPLIPYRPAYITLPVDLYIQTILLNLISQRFTP